MRPISRALALLLLLPALGSCSGQALNIGSDDGGVSHSGRCSSLAGDTLPYKDTADVLTRLAGRWILCASGGDAGVLRQAAIELTTDHTWVALHADGGGHWTRSDTSGGQGIFTVGKVISAKFADAPTITFDQENDNTVVVAFQASPSRMMWSTLHARDLVARYEKE